MVYSTSSNWVVEFADKRIVKELVGMDSDIRADFASIVDLIQTYGLPKVGAPHVKHLRGKLWEMRMRGKDGIARAAYVVATGKRVIVVHCFVKKTQTTPSAIIELALQRAKAGGWI